MQLTAVSSVGFFTWNTQSFLERWTRRGLMAAMAVGRPFLYLANRGFATRVLHTVLRGISRDRLDLLGEEYFHYTMKPALNRRGVRQLKQARDAGARIVLVSHGLDHIIRPLANYLGVEEILCNHLDFREDLATGRLLDPVVRPRGPLARVVGQSSDGHIGRDKLARSLGFADTDLLEKAIRPARRLSKRIQTSGRTREAAEKSQSTFSVRDALRGKNVLLIGATGFIGKVWLAHILQDLPEIGRIYLLIRRNRAHSSVERFQRIVEESPAFDALAGKYGERLGDFLGAHVTVVEGDLAARGLGLAPEAEQELLRTVDVVINSAGLTDFNPELREALTANLQSTANLIEFVKRSDHAALLHLSTCYVAGAKDGRIPEEASANYTPLGVAGFDAEREWRSLEKTAEQIEERSKSTEVTEELRQRAFEKKEAAKDLHGAALENQIRKNRVRWVRQALIDAGMKRANELGWPNTYTLTKSLAESLLVTRGAGLPIAIVRPSIVESSLKKPFPGWNEGINTSASLSWLLGTYFRQLPTNERKALDVIPVDVVARGMTLIAAGLAGRTHEPVYQLATSVSNPCNMRRSIELTSLAHRKYYRAQNGMRHWLRSRFEAIPVSKARYDKLSAPAQKAVVHALHRTLDPLPFVRTPLARRERDLERTIRVVQLFEPFILYNDHIFEASRIEAASAALPADERETFGYEARSVDWWDYWINVHIPALRRWSYPLIEGRPLPPRDVRTVFHSQDSGGVTAEASQTVPAAGT